MQIRPLALLPVVAAAGLLFTATARHDMAQASGSALPAPVTDDDYMPASPAEVELGRLLFWDKALSGNRNISCSTCHHPRFGTSDGLSLGMGEGGIGVGPDRKPDPANYPEQRVPRNSPALWNTGAKEYTALFADGRIQVDASRPAGIRTPLEDEMVRGFHSLLSAQTMFPVLSPDEMAGHYEENDVSTLVRQGRLTGPDGAWAKISARIAAYPEYQALFAKAYPEIAAGRAIDFTDISNAVAAFMTVDFRSDTSPFDAFLRGQGDLSPLATEGMTLFYGSAGCATCHSGPFQSDQKFHAMGEPQLGPGKAERFEHHQQDLGRMRVSNDPADRYAFRTPSLRNVTLTAPYGHAGAHRDLAGFLRYHTDPKGGIAAYTLDAVLPAMDVGKDDWGPAQDGTEYAAIAAAVTTPPVVLTDAETTAILAFLSALEDPIAVKGGRMGIPDKVPSGLPIDR
jgi:cytochrome c peroxidase